MGVRVARWLLGIFGVFLVYAFVAANVAAPSPPLKPQACDAPDTDHPVYDGTGGCHPGGELVHIADVVTADRYRLDDGRVVRLLGVDAPAPGECAAPAAADEARKEAGGRWANLLTQGQRDSQGDVLGYLEVGPLAGEPPGPGSYITDVGHLLVFYGWARAGSGATAEYAAEAAKAERDARDLHSGQFGPPCAPGDLDAPPAPAAPGAASPTGGQPNVHVDVDVHHRGGLPDGVLTGGFCRRHWWC